MDISSSPTAEYQHETAVIGFIAARTAYFAALDARFHFAQDYWDNLLDAEAVWAAAEIVLRACRTV